MDDLIGHSIAYRVAMGPRAGQKAFTLQTEPAQLGEAEREGVARAAGFCLHAGIAIEAQARGKLERLCRYVSRRRWPRSGSRSPSAARNDSARRFAVRPLAVRSSLPLPAGSDIKPFPRN